MKFRRSTVRIKTENKPIYDEWKDGRANQHVTNDIMDAIVEAVLTITNMKKDLSEHTV